MTEAKSNWGGKRPGAGRHPAHTAEVRIRIDEECLRKIKERGGRDYIEKLVADDDASWKNKNS